MSSTTVSSSPNRWVIAGAAFFMQLALGAVYAWSVFLVPVQNVYGLTGNKAEANFTFSMALLALGITASFGGYLNARFGPRAIATAGGIIYGAGIMLSAFAAPNIGVLYLTYGVIGGIGIGLGYIVALAMLIRWFPDRRGFITGLAVAGFGAGAALTGPIASNFLLGAVKLGKPSPAGYMGLNNSFLVLGAVYLVIIVIAAQFFRRAPEGYTPPGWEPVATPQNIATTRNYILREALVSPKWWVLWLILALNVTAGAALISVASPLAVKFTGVTSTVASTLVITISIFNGVGRLFWGWTSDFIGRSFTFLAIFVIQIVAFLVLPSISSFALLFIPASLIGFCYGGGFGTMPAFAADFFGPKNAGMIYGAMLTAWSAGGIVGPLLIGALDYSTALYIITAMLVVSCAFPFLSRYLAAQPEKTIEVATGGGND